MKVPIPAFGKGGLTDQVPSLNTINDGWGYFYLLNEAGHFIDSFSAKAQYNKAW